MVHLNSSIISTKFQLINFIYTDLQCPQAKVLVECVFSRYELNKLQDKHKNITVTISICRDLGSYMITEGGFFSPSFFHVKKHETSVASHALTSLIIQHHFILYDLYNAYECVIKALQKICLVV